MEQTGNAMDNMNHIVSIKKHAPCYVYDRSTIIRNCAALASHFPMIRFLYSIKVKMKKKRS